MQSGLAGTDDARDAIVDEDVGRLEDEFFFFFDFILKGDIKRKLKPDHSIIGSKHISLYYSYAYL